MRPQKRGRAGHGGSCGGGRSRGNSATNGAATGDDNQRKRNNRTVRFEGTPSTGLPNGTAAPSQPKSNRPFQLQKNSSGRNENRQTNGIKAATMDDKWRDPTATSLDAYKNKMSDYFQKLKERRIKERATAISQGLMSDPEKPTKLADAITLVGTCQDMCAEHERVERIVANEVDECEKVQLDVSSNSPGRRAPFEEHMVKRFNRSSAGKEEELPSDVRPPLILQKTVDYLFNELIESSRTFPSVQAFIWNRTRAIRVDFSIQHISKLPDLRIAIDCLERIARFHIVSLHQRSLVIEANEHFSHQQESEQLKNTLLSLSYYYNDSRHRLRSPNEAEFRAYSIIYFLQNQETEQEAQNWPKDILWAPRVQQALKLYAAAGNTTDSYGPLAPKTPQSIAQGHYGRFWKIVGSKEISYLMACTAEIHFNRIRKAALTSIWKSRSKLKVTEDWNLGDLIQILGCDDEAQVRKYCGAHGFRIVHGARGIPYVDFTSVSDAILDPSPSLKQTFSERLVECKRYDRTLTAIINGIAASTARDEGMIEDLTAEDSPQLSKQQPDSIFVQDDSDDSDEELPALADLKPTTNGVNLETDSTKPNPFASALPTIKRNPFTLDDGVDTASDAMSTIPPNPFINTQSSRIASHPPSSTPFTIAQPSISTFPLASKSLANPFTPNPAVSRAPAPPARSSFGLPSVPTVAPATSLNRTSTSFLPPPPAKTEPEEGNSATKPDKPSGSSSSIIQIHNLQESSTKPFFTQKSNPFAPDSDSSSIFGAPSLTRNTSPAAPQQTSTPFFPSADSPSIFGPPPSSAKPVTTTQQQPAVFFPHNTTPPPIFGAPSSSTSSTTTAPQQPSNPFFPSKKPLPSASKTSPPSTEPIVSTPQQPSLFLPAAGQSSAFAASQPSDHTFSFLNTNTATDSAPSASQPLQKDSRSAFNSAKDTQSNPFPVSLTSQKDAPASSRSLFPPPNKSPFMDHPKEPPPFQDPAAQAPQAALGQYQRSAIQSLTPSKPGNPAVLEQLSESVFLDSEGLLEQLIEYTAGPIILEAMRQVEEEKLQKKKDDVCWRIQARYWIEKWKKYAYRLGLARKGRERRRRYAEDMKTLAHASKRRTAEAELDEYFDSRRTQLDKSSPVKKPRVDNETLQHSQSGRQSRKSLPPDIGRPQQGSSSAPAGARQQGQDADASMDISSSAPSKKLRNHQRSRTHVDPSTLTRSQRTTQKISPSASATFRSSFLSGKSVLDNSILSSSRSLVPNGRIDTTRTPYFRLKALRLTPSRYSRHETPNLKQGTKRSRGEENEGLENSKSAKVTVPGRNSKVNDLDGRSDPKQQTGHDPVEPETTTSMGGKVDDEDEELFAQMRQVKEAMAESIQLYQEERARDDVSRSVSGGSGDGKGEQARDSRGVQGFGSCQERPREAWRKPRIEVANAVFDEVGEVDEEMEDVNGKFDEDEEAEENQEDDEEEEVEVIEDGVEDERDEEYEEDVEDEKVEDVEEDFEEDVNDEEFNRGFEDSEEEEDDDSGSIESEDLADISPSGTTTSSTAYMSGALLNPRRPASQPTQAIGKGSSIEDAIEL